MPKKIATRRLMMPTTINAISIALTSYIGRDSNRIRKAEERPLWQMRGLAQNESWTDAAPGRYQFYAGQGAGLFRTDAKKLIKPSQDSTK
jgi:hypothetical protein